MEGGGGGGRRVEGAAPPPPCAPLSLEHAQHHSVFHWRAYYWDITIEIVCPSNPKFEYKCAWDAYQLRKLGL